MVRVPGFTHPVEDFYLENILQLTGASGVVLRQDGSEGVGLTGAERGCLCLRNILQLTAGLRWHWSQIHTALLRQKQNLPYPTSTHLHVQGTKRQQCKRWAASLAPAAALQAAMARQLRRRCRRQSGRG